jgi:putative ABC transport system permease protein
MVSNWLLTWLRNFRRYKLYLLINIAGLSLGLSAVLAIVLYISDEVSYDQFQQNRERIYRVNNISRFAGLENRYFTTAAPVGEAIRNEVTSVETVARMFGRQAALQVIDSAAGDRADTKFRQDNFYFADPAVLDVFTFQFLAGDRSSALSDPSKLVISETAAKLYFGSATDAIGKTLLFEGRLPLTVSAVFSDWPDQSHLQVEMLTHFDHFFTEEREEIRQYLHSDWIYNPVTTYVMLRPGADPVRTEEEINKLRVKYGDQRVKESLTYELQALPRVHLYSDFTFTGETSLIRYVYMLGSIAILIVLVACVNFVNLSNVHSLKRAKEIGVRKMLGAGRRVLASQFMGESGLLVFVSFAIAMMILFLSLPLVNEVAGKSFAMRDVLTPQVMIFLPLLFLLTALLGGTYPVMFITRFNPIVVLRGLSGNKLNEGYRLRQVLVVGQFTISVSLVVLAIVFYRQMEYMRTKSLGFDRQNMLTIPLFSEQSNSILGGGVDGPLRQRMNAFENDLVQNAGVEAVTASSGLPGSGAVSALVQTEKIKEQDNVFVAAMAVDYDFIPAYNMMLLAGRDFSREFGTDHLQAFIINEKAVSLLGWESPEKAVGQSMSMMGKQGTIVGVVKDFHFQGLQQPLRPLALEVAASKFTVFSLRLHSSIPLAESIEKVRTEWDKAFPEKVFEYNFLDQRLELAYGSEQRLVRMMTSFSVLAIVISALGLFGLSAYINHQRSREICIRKVLGAGVSDMFMILSKEFFVMVSIAFLVAVPVSYVLAGRWLESFAFRIDVGWLPFVMGALLATATVLITISYETLRTARINPADKLRPE